MDGWIKLHRKLLDNPIMQKEGLLQLFIYCLLKANHEPEKIIFNGKEMIIKKGQFITGKNVLAKALKQKMSTTHDRLKVLANLQIIDIKSNNKFSLVTLVNYEVYQQRPDESDINPDNQPTTSRQPAEPNKNLKNIKNIKNKDIYSLVLDHLNQKASTNYRPTAKSTQALIDARLNNGFTADDFIKVIDKKCAEWIGIDQEMYLRPSTLFGTKFEGYLNQKITKLGGKPNGTNHRIANDRPAPGKYADIAIKECDISGIDPADFPD